MKNEFVPYEIAITLKELGFNELCLGGYYKDKTFEYPPDSDIVVDTPLYQQCFRFFREKYGLSHEIHLKMSNNKRKIWYNINELDNRLIPSMYFKSYPKGLFKTYEEAELECLKKLIEIVKNK